MVVAHHRFRAMGTDCHIQVVDGPACAGELAESIVRADEARWSRFRPDSELCRSDVGTATTADGPVVARCRSDVGTTDPAWSPETTELVHRALLARATTEGWFDPTLGHDITAAGYDRSFEAIGTDTPRAPATTIDVGGIAKGHSADRVVDALLAAGAAGACANLGGDLRCAGAGPADEGWWCSLDHAPDVVLGLDHGGVATSTTTKRRWQNPDGTTAHHLLDPRTRRPSDTDRRSATVVAATAAHAEVLTKVALLAPWPDAVRIVGGHGAHALVTLADGRTRTIGAIDAYLAGAARCA